MHDKNPAVYVIPRRKKYLPRILLSLTLIMVFLGVVLFGAYYLLLGKSVNSAAINDKVIASVQSVIGKDYIIEVGETKLDLNSLTHISVASLDISIFESSHKKTSKINTPKKLVEIDKVEFELEPFSILDAVPQIRNIIIDGVILNAESMLKEFSKKKSVITDPQFSIRNSLINVAKAAHKIEKYLLAGAFDKLELKNISILGADLARLSPKPIQITSFVLKGEESGSFDIVAKLTSGETELNITSAWLLEQGGRRVLNVDASPILTREWLNAPKIDPSITFGIGSDAKLMISAKLPFKNITAPLQPVIKVKSQESTLRIGGKQNTKIKSIDLNIRLLPASNQIQIERSTIIGLDTKIQFVGGIIPADKLTGYKGILNFDLVAEKITSKSPQTNVKTIPVSALLLGQWEFGSKRITFDSVQLIAERKQINGSADVLFEGKSPAINGYFETDEFSMDALRQMWPFFMATNARDWIGSSFSGGYLKNANMEVAIPINRIFELKNFTPFEKSELKFNSQYVGLRSKTFGKLPPIFDVSGDAKIIGSELIVNVHSAKAHSPAKNIVDVEMGRVTFKDFSQKNPRLDIEMHLAGKLSTLTAVANVEPLNVAKRVLVKPADLSGDALVDVVTNFRLYPNNKVRDLNWNALVTLENASSDKPVFGRALKKANLLLEITPDQIVGKGKAQIDGAYSDFSFIEPLGNKAKVKRKFNLSTLFTQKQLKQQGLDFDPIIKGPLGLKIVSGKNNAQIYTIDLTKADISLPWIGWLKGAGIFASAQFEYTLKKGVTTLSNLKFIGDGIDAQGQIKFTKKGLLSADLKNITLVGDENFDVKIKKEKGRFVVNVIGDSFDGRSVINQILHENALETAADGEAENDITLTASFGRIEGFAGNYMTNAKIYYKTQSGKISALNVEGALNNVSKTTVIAQRINNGTTFEIKSQNAGAAFAMANLYSKMQGGSLSAKLHRVGDGPFVGPVKIRKFIIVGEKKLRAFANVRTVDKKYEKVSGHLKKINVKSVKFRSLTANIEKGLNYLNISDGIIRSNEIGFTFEGAAFDTNDKMNIRGTFMPAIALSRLVGLIPIVGQIFSNGKDGALLGITYRLRGPIKQPKLEVNPLSLVTPGIFNKIFEFKE